MKIAYSLYICLHTGMILQSTQSNIVSHLYCFYFSLARRPIGPGCRRSKLATMFSGEGNVSDEGNTSEYSRGPSSRGSTLESVPDLARTVHNMGQGRKRPHMVCLKDFV